MNATEAERYEPGQPAPVTGLYDEHNPLGFRTGVTVMAEKGRALPRLPRGYFWRFKPNLPELISAFTNASRNYA